MGYHKLENQPLKLILAELRFSPILNVLDYIPKLQDRLRDLYPLLEKGQDKAVNINVNEVQVQNMERWIFISKDKRSLVDISQDRLLFVTSVYDRFGPFSESFQHVIQVIADVLKPALFSRLGLRYIDAVVPLENEKLEDLIDDSFLMPIALSKFSDRNLGHKTESGVQVNDGHLIVRTLHLISNMVVMPDQNQVPIIIPASDEEKKVSVRVLLDFDHYWHNPQNQEDFNVSAILERLSHLHQPSRQAFFSMTTDKARNEKWS